MLSLLKVLFPILSDMIQQLFFYASSTRLRNNTSLWHGNPFGLILVYFKHSLKEDLL